MRGVGLLGLAVTLSACVSMSTAGEGVLPRRGLTSCENPIASVRQTSDLFCGLRLGADSKALCSVRGVERAASEHGSGSLRLRLRDSTVLFVSVSEPPGGIAAALRGEELRAVCDMPVTFLVRYSPIVQRRCTAEQSFSASMASISGALAAKSRPCTELHRGPVSSARLVAWKESAHVLMLALVQHENGYDVRVFQRDTTDFSLQYECA